MKSRLHSTGGLLAAFATKPESIGTRSPHPSEQSLNMRSKKRSRSFTNVSRGLMESLVMTTRDVAVEKVASVKRLKGRSRSRPRAIEGTSNADGYMSGVEKVESSIFIPIKQLNDTLEVFQPRSSGGRAALASRVSPRRSRYNPPRKIERHFDKLDMKKNAELSDAGVPKQGARGRNITEDVNFAVVKGCIEIISLPDINKTMSQESDESIFITPTKKRARNDSNDADALPSSINQIDQKKSPLANKCTTVTPSPSEKSDSLSNAVPTRQKGRNIGLDGCNKTSTQRYVKLKRLKRVSKRRGNGTKKPTVVLTKAITVGRKTIPARQVAKLRKTKPPPVKKIQMQRETAHTSKYLKQRRSPSSKKNTVQTIDFNETDNLTKRLETTRKQCATIKGKKRLEAAKLLKIKPNGNADMKGLNHGKNRKASTSLKKEAMVKFISEMMNDLENLKATVTNSDDRNIIDLVDLKRDFIPLSKMDVILDCRGKGKTRHRKGKLATTSSKHRSLASSRNTPLVPFFSMQTPVGHKVVFSPFSGPDFGEDESACESVIDLGTISNSQALLSYTRYGSPDESEDKSSAEDSASERARSGTLDRKRPAGKSRLQNYGSDILATLGCATADKRKRGSDSKATSSSRSNGDGKDSREIATQFVETPAMEKQAPLSENNSLGPKINDPFEELLAMDHDDLIEEELKKRAKDFMPNEFALVKVGYREFDDTSSSSDDSMQDDLMLDIPTLAY